MILNRVVMAMHSSYLRTTWAIGSMGLWLLAALVGLPSSRCLARSIAIEDFSVAIEVDESSTLEVTETIRLRFDGQWNGIHRSIPVASRTPQGLTHHIGLQLQDVSDERGQRLKVERSRHGNDVDLKIYVPNAADAVRTVVIRYRVDHGLRFFEDHDELYWNVTGDQWPYPIGAARVKVTLPGRLVNVRANAFTGAAGSKERSASITIDGIAHEPDDAFKPAGESPPPDSDSHVVEIAASRALGIHEGLTAAVAWNPGVIKRPSGWAKAWSTWWTNWWTWFTDRSFLAGIVGGPFLLFGMLFAQWWRVGRDPRGGPDVVQYEPPEGLTPGEAGTLMDNKPDNRDLIANLVDTAVKRVIRIREVRPAGWLFGAKYAFDLLAHAPQWQEKGVSRSGQKILRGIFGWHTEQAAGPDGVLATVLSTDLDDTFYRHLPEIRDAIFDDLAERGFYAERPDKVTRRYLAYGVASSLSVLAVATVAAFNSQQPVTLAAIVMSTLTLSVFAIFAAIMPARTVAGVRVRSAIRGFKEFLSRVDADRLASLPLTPELFERYLPYAIALGVERRWARKFGEICTVPPQWYAGSHSIDSFDPSRFTHSLGQMSNYTLAAMTSSPSSDSRSSRSSWGLSGFSGGGRSGGGSGGGGGSGF